MGSSQSVPAQPPMSAEVCVTKPEVNPLNPKGLKPCCACPETKSARDDCFLKTDASIAEESCRELVQKHIACMRGYGFKV
ncbi:hypothetical protein M408DRAFT_133804 [Serendipita vermifera MAFF 305830]|uniref:Cytochrome c oxidase copper chaperone COX17 n=1 Tax=Serendipita vermifera MAFF 305830 TaxID=933852 RepID=A0A0C3BBI4_SERVB|nr:hypothetical protein M408DRAFT_133804 [Serendipita vermifera MAFF 305830]